MRDVTHYFAYGSNLSRARLQARVPEAKPLGRARLEGWALCFDKHGRDQHAKANIRSSSGEHVWGAVYHLPSALRDPLDRAEGLGVEYAMRRVRITVDAPASVIEAYTYVALRICPGLPLQDWYLGHVLAGIVDHGLPQHWRGQVSRIAAAHTLIDASRCPEV